ncbi:MAG: tetratricopeptide repeat-containing serine/threonine-protein kinase, partial [Verrucomicrobiota bacterium]|nr:tetratricopeptide repeat-containing serine/threonine-protein kinase [Verrucomicrobiota bacterium]
MQSKRWQSCTDIFDEAVEQPLNARAAFLERSCNGDEALRRKVELLLKYHDESGDFIESPAFVVAPELLVDDPDALIGQHLGSYRVDAVLGAGGMGVVYLAYDERLGRKVGLKLLPASLLAKEGRFERLKREARTASALNHPNIMTIHEVGEVDSTHYIATEFIEGTTLRERMNKSPIPPNEALDIVIQVATALCVAHRAGIVHRDIKPENVMLRPDGYVKVLDFGIAKFTQQETLVARTSPGVPAATQQGLILGTTRYMSPEQARGQTVDARSDLWSLGVVLYEMLAGRPPFDGATPTDVIAAVLLKRPEPVEQRATIVPPALQRVVEKSLRKDPAERHQTAEELLSELRANEGKTNGIPRAVPSIVGYNRARRTVQWIGVGAIAVLLVCVAVFYGWRNRQADRPEAPAPIEKGIAVLPFENLSAEKDDAFFANGMQDDVLTSVGKIKDLKVIARASVMDYRGARLAGKVREIGHSLGVSHVLEGSVRRVADRVVMNVALIDTRDERQVWSERYERTMADSIGLQGELATQIASALSARLSPEEKKSLETRPTDNPQAYALYLKALARGAKVNSSIEDALAEEELYRQAIALDPKFALAHACLSMSSSQLANDTGEEGRRAEARSEAEEALRLSPSLGEAHLALGLCLYHGEKNYPAALSEFLIAAASLPNEPGVLLRMAGIYRRQGRWRESLATFERAQILDPLNRWVLLLSADAYMYVRDWPAATACLNRLLEIAPDWAYAKISLAYVEVFRNGNVAAAKETLRQIPAG